MLLIDSNREKRVLLHTTSDTRLEAIALLLSTLPYCGSLPTPQSTSTELMVAPFLSASAAQSIDAV